MHVASGKAPALHGAQDWRHAFIASFPGQPNDETPEATEAAAYAGVQAHLMAVKDDDAVVDIEAVLADLDDVYISLPTAPWQIYREVRRSHVTVSLDGHGADELMGAYRQQGASFGFSAAQSTGPYDKWFARPRSSHGLGKGSVAFSEGAQLSTRASLTGSGRSGFAVRQ